MESVGYIGPNPPVPIIIEGLRRLEYRGYDSAGIAIAGAPDGKMHLRRAPGKLRNLEALISDDPLPGSFGIGHTRWATHGRPTEENAHPHRDCTGTLVVVHNGIVENYLALKSELTAKGHKFVTETDTEIIAHLIEQELSDGSAPIAPAKEIHTEAPPPVRLPPIPLEEAVRRAVKRLTGAFAIGVLSANEPDKLVAARFGPPAVLGIGDGEYFLASDVPGILHHTRNIHFLADGELAILTSSGITLTDFDGAPIPLKTQRIAWDPIQAEKAGYKHFMLKEIYEQPRAIRDTILGRVSPDTGHIFLPDMSITEADLRNATQVTIAACGTSWHSGLAGKFMIERLARLRCDVDYASEYRYRDPIADPLAIGLLITQSGETAEHPRRPARTHRRRQRSPRHLQRSSEPPSPAKPPGHHHHPAYASPGNRRRLHQGLHRPTHRALPPRAQIRPGPRHRLRRRIPPPRRRTLPHPRQARLHAQPQHPRSHRRRRRHRSPHPPPNFTPSNLEPSWTSNLGRAAPTAASAPALTLTAQCEELAKIFHTANDFLFLERARHALPHRPRRARSSSRRSPTSTPKATPPAR